MVENANHGERRRHLVVANFFPAFYPPTSGGEQRYYHLYEQISLSFDVTLVSTTYADRPEELVEHSATFREYRVPKHPDSDLLHWQLDQRGIGPECSGFVVALGGALDGAFGERFRGLVKTADAVVHESPFTVAYDTGIGRDGIPRIYNSYNVEADLARQMLRGQIGADAAVFIEDLERHLLENSALVFATSREESEIFIRRYGVDSDKVHLAPNGFDESAVLNEMPIDRSSSNTVVFVGSGHPPNVEALDFIAAKIAPVCPHLHFVAVGSVCKAFHGAVPRNLHLRGFVSAEEKSKLLSTCTAAINPLFSGAGTNLKMLDYMGHGAPIVATPIGARGLELIDGELAAIATSENFADTLIALAADPRRAGELGRNAWREAREKYSWKSIGESVSRVFQQLLGAPNLRPRRRLLSVCDYPVDAKSGGGEVRAHHLLSELGREFDVVFLCLTDANESSEVALSSGVIQRAVAKTAEHRLHQQRTTEGEWISVADIVSARECLGNRELLAAFKSELERADAVLFEQCYLAPLLEFVPPGMPIVYSSQNHEVELKEALLAQRRDGPALLDEVRMIERRMALAATLIVCVSETDARSFSARYAGVRVTVVENGVDIPTSLSRYGVDRADSSDAPVAVFVGSGHPPNIAAVRFIIESLAPATPFVAYAIVGSVCDAFKSGAVPGNVLLLGKLSGSDKLALLQQADIAVNPMFEGGGSSLKVPDFFSVGLPTISSKLGVRGYPVVPGVHYAEAEAADFCPVLSRLIADPLLRMRIGSNALHLVRRDFDWQVLGGKLRRRIRELLPSRGGRKRLLVVTYRFGDPPRGGAETYLAKVIESIAAKGSWDITIAGTAVGSIQNHQMFSAHYEPPTTDDKIPSWARNVTLFPADEFAAGTQDECRNLHSLWMAESRVLGKRFSAVLPEAALAGGWNYPETDGKGKSVRWTSSCSQIKVPRGSERLALTLHASSPTLIELWHETTLISTEHASGWITIHCNLPRSADLIEVRCPQYRSHAEDVRELGVLVSDIGFGIGKTWHEVDLRHELDLVPQRVPLQEWVSALIDLVGERNVSDDEKFLRVRGPHSTKLLSWLRAETQNYDVVLAHGVPFASSANAVDAARRAGVPVVVLPHYHMEDRYYHWQAFYETFRNADNVVAAPNASVSVFFEKIGANAIALPGGGVTPEEFDEKRLDIGRKAFLALYSSATPFILVLGRKADGKNYRLVLEAHRRLREQGIALNLVMIGPDDDGHPVFGDGVIYLGAQPRAVVIGALAQAQCLATMSESESFGIVLLEAWLAGTTVVASGRSTAFAELVEDNVNGKVVHDIDSLTEAIRLYHEHPALAESHALAGKKVAQAYAWREIATKFDSILATLACGMRHAA